MDEHETPSSPSVLDYATPPKIKRRVALGIFLGIAGVCVSVLGGLIIFAGVVGLIISDASLSQAGVWMIVGLTVCLLAGLMCRSARRFYTGK